MHVHLISYIKCRRGIMIQQTHHFNTHSISLAEKLVHVSHIFLFILTLKKDVPQWGIEPESDTSQSKTYTTEKLNRNRA